MVVARLSVDPTSISTQVGQYTHVMLLHIRLLEEVRVDVMMVLVSIF